MDAYNAKTPHGGSRRGVGAQRNRIEYGRQPTTSRRLHREALRVLADLESQP